MKRRSRKSQTLLTVPGNQTSCLYQFKNCNIEQFTSLQDLLSSSASWEHGLSFFSRLTFLRPTPHIFSPLFSSPIITDNFRGFIPLEVKFVKLLGTWLFFIKMSDKERNARAYCSHQCPSNFALARVAQLVGVSSCTSKGCRFDVQVCVGKYLSMFLCHIHVSLSLLRSLLLSLKSNKYIFLKTPKQLYKHDVIIIQAEY